MDLASVLPRFLRRARPITTAQANLPIALVGYSTAGKDFLIYALLQELYTAKGLLPLAFRTSGGPPYCRVSFDRGETWTPPENFPNFRMSYGHFEKVSSTTPTGGPKHGGAGALGIQIGMLGRGGKEVNLALWNTVGQDPAIVENAGAYLFCIRATDVDLCNKLDSNRGILRPTLAKWAAVIGKEVNTLSRRTLPFAIVLTACDELGSGKRVYETLGSDFWRVWRSKFQNINAHTGSLGFIYKAAAMTRWATPRLWEMLVQDPVFGPPLQQLVGRRSLPPIFLTSAVDGRYLLRADGTREEYPSPQMYMQGPQPILASAPFLYLLTKMRPHEFNCGNW